MTERQHRILFSALELFAKEGYDRTSTSRIARHASVSEGLIFRHFQNKKGLLEAIMVLSAEKFREMVEPILQESDPQLVLKKAIEMPFDIDRSDYDFWRLQFKLAWDNDLPKQDVLSRLIEKMSEAFTARGVTEPTNEAVMLFHVISAISKELLRGKAEAERELKNYLLRKYNLLEVAT
ncbi:MAG: TetR/AcrR family transcriptional regulator [Bacteroidota bacterium]